MKTKYHHGNLRESLIQTALKIIEKDGLSSLTLRDIALEVGTSHSAIYRHFSSKEDLIQTVMLEGFEKFENLIAPILLQKEHTVIQRLQNMGIAYIDFAIKNPTIYRMIFGPELQDTRMQNSDINDETKAAGFHALIALLVEGQESGLFKKDNPMIQATVIWSTIHGLSNLFIDGHLHVKENLEIIFNTATKTLLEGLKV